MGGAAFGFQLFSRGATLCLDGPAHFVEAHQRKGIPIHIFEPGETPPQSGACSARCMDGSPEPRSGRSYFMRRKRGV